MTLFDLVWSGASPASEASVAELETRLGVEFPPSYRRLLAVANGGTPDGHATFTVQHPRIGRMRSGLGLVLDVRADEPESIEGRMADHRAEGILAEGLVPFGEDGGGDLMCFDFRAGRHNPRIVYVAISAREADRVMPLASSFDDFLGALHVED